MIIKNKSTALTMQKSTENARSDSQESSKSQKITRKKFQNPDFHQFSENNHYFVYQNHRKLRQNVYICLQKRRFFRVNTLFVSISTPKLRQNVHLCLKNGWKLIGNVHFSPRTDPKWRPNDHLPSKTNDSRTKKIIYPQFLWVPAFFCP